MSPTALREGTALVTGATGGIGGAFVAALAEEGVRLAVSARAGPRLERVAGETGAVAVAADLATPDGPTRLAEEARRRLGGTPDLLANVAGAFELAPAAETDPASFDRHLQVNLRAPFRLVRAFLPRMLERGSGTLLHVGSVAGRQAFPENAAYAASKYGLRGLHEVLRLELAGTGVRTLLVDPGPVDTAAWDPVEARLGDDLPAREAMLSPRAVARALVEALRAGEGTAQGDVLLLPG